MQADYLLMALIIRFKVFEERCFAAYGGELEEKPFSSERIFILVRWLPRLEEQQVFYFQYV